ncbi:MAG: PVC-type heme-binding CxxCH protein [Planctomycetota bacterium]
MHAFSKHTLCYVVLLVSLSTSSLPAGENVADGNRLVYLDAPCDPFYVHRSFPKLVTPQWIGEDGVEAVVVLSIDDMRDPARYEQFLRPILNRLHEIDGRAPLSILTNSVDPKDKQLQSWLKEGLSLEVHTMDHPCPCLGGGDFAAARSTYERCVDLMSSIPENAPVAYRMPCCDSINSTSPRFWAEIFNKTSAEGNFLQIDSSVFHAFSPNDDTLPRDLVVRDDGNPRFRYYLPFSSFVNTIEDYPYPYPIADLCWEIPCLVPSDWEGQHVQRPNNPETVDDMKRALDATVVKQGSTSLVFHPHGWIRSEQIVEFIDHSREKHGDKLKFLSFRDCLERFNENLLAGEALRAQNGQDNGVRLLDLNNDGFLDVVIGNERVKITRLWSPTQNRWQDTSFPVAIVHADEEGNHHGAGVQFFVSAASGHASFYLANELERGVWHFRDDSWQRDDAMLEGLEIDGRPIATSQDNRDLGVRFRDLDGDGVCELIAGGQEQAILQWSPDEKRWNELEFQLPEGNAIVDSAGGDAGLRFVDFNSDGKDDLIFSDEAHYSAHLFTDLERGWSVETQRGERPADNDIPPIVRNGTNNGAWFSNHHMWVQNEDTQRLPDLVDRRSFADLTGQQAQLPKSPEDSLRCIEVSNDLQVQLVACEPLVQDPVAFDWGLDGCLWVVEMADYPLGLDDRGQVGGRIKRLTDKDGDGVYDHADLFAEGLAFPTDIMTWKDGVLVTAAPNIWYMEDEDGDGQAEHRQILYSGFGEGNQQHRVNGLRWGLDNWIYVANGDSGGQVQSRATGKRINIRGRDLRIEPRTGGLEAIAGQTQHGRGRDDWGNWWGATNNRPFFQYLLQDKYQARNIHVASPDPRFIAGGIDWGLYPISRILSHWSGYQPPAPGQASQFTSACGTHAYSDNALGQQYSGNIFISEPVHNLIHRRSVRFDGLLMIPEKPADESGREFLRSQDSWFRPTTIRTGPDGALWFADMYRLVIEHPEWIDDEEEKRLDLRAGHDKGRIYRVISRKKSASSIPNYSQMSSSRLVEQLASSNGYSRDMAHRILVWEQDKASIPSLIDTLSSRNVYQRLHARCVLEGLGALTPEHVIQGLQDEHPALRRHALRLAETWVGHSSADKVLDAMLVLSETEKEPQVLLQLAYTLGQFDQAKAGQALGALMVRYQANEYIRAAAISGIVLRLGDVAEGAMQEFLSSGAHNASWMEGTLSTAIALGNSEAITKIVASLVPRADQELEEWQLQVLSQIVGRLRKQNLELSQVFSSDPQAALGLWSAARQTLSAKGASGERQPSESTRIAAMKLLASAPDFGSQDLPSVLAFMSTQSSTELQRAALSAISVLKPGDQRSVLEHWDSFGPLLQERLTAVFIQKEVSAELLLGEIAKGNIDPREIAVAYRQMLMEHPNSELANSAKALFAKEIDATRQTVIDRYLPTVEAGGNAASGEQYFRRTCAQCHQVKGIGHVVGPDIQSLTDKSPLSLTTHILDPGRALEDKYKSYRILTLDGRLINGILQRETSNAITLLGQNGESHTVLRSDIEENGFRQSSKSMMPEGIESSLNPQALADVVAFVLGNQAPPKQFDGNKPALIKPNEGSGVIRLHASRAEVYGPSIVFEQMYRNLGYWSNSKDRAQWLIDSPEAQEYQVFIDWALAEQPGRSALKMQSGSSSLSHEVSSTGSWDEYRQTEVGRLKLKAGKQYLLIQSLGEIHGVLLDLREVCLVPVGQQPPGGFLRESGP